MECAGRQRVHVEHGEREQHLRVHHCSHADSTQLQKYLQLPQKGSVIAEYVWIDASGGTRSKCKVSQITFSAEGIGATDTSSANVEQQTAATPRSEALGLDFAAASALSALSAKRLVVPLHDLSDF